MAAGVAFTAQGLQGGDWLVLGRLLREDSSTHNMVACVPADVTSVTRYVVDLKDGATVLFDDSLVVSTIILASLSAGNVWSLDTIGFNFRDQIPGSKLTNSDGVELQYVIVLADSTVVKLHIDIDLKSSN